MIIDGNALIHRSFHALPPTLATKDGRMVNAVYGFTAVLLKALRELKPEYVVLTLDKKEPTFRHKEYKEYKATRVKAPDELYEQIPLVKEVARAFNIEIFEKEGFEADDLIGTIVCRTDHGVEKIILTGDMDTLQLVDADTKVYTMSRGVTESATYDEKAVRERYGLAPKQMVDYKALRGDPSDNIPGVKGVGEKTAVELLKEFKTLENLYENLDSKKTKIKPRILELLKEFKDDAFLSKRLATIECNVGIDFDLEKARFGKFDQSEVIKLFSDFEFKSLLPRIRDLTINNSQLTINKKEGGRSKFENKFERNQKLFNYILVDDEKSFNAFLKKLGKQKEFVIDTETSSLDPLTASLLGISFSWKEGEAYYVNFQFPISNFQSGSKNKIPKMQASLFGKKEDDKNEKMNRNEWLKRLRPVLENERVKIFGHNSKFDMRVLRNYGLNMNVFFDSMIASYLLNPGSRQHNLDAVTFAEFGFEKISVDDLLGKGKEKITFSEIPLEKIFIYSCEDADFTLRLAKKLAPELRKNKLENLFRNIEMPLVSVLAEMENNGIKLDDKFLRRLSQEIGKKIGRLEKKIKDLAGMNFNINSTQQLREVLFEKLEIPTLLVGKTKTGLSTSADELMKLRDYHPIIRLIQDYRELTKLANTYVDALTELVNKKTGRLHTSFNQTVTATGRLSSTEPNLQNIPIRTEIGREIRKAFIADKGFRLLSLDYSQIELRLAAHMSGDPAMIKAFQKNEDIHAATAAAINGVILDKVTPEMRREAKAVNFGILYGQGPHGLSQSADIPYIKAKEFIDEYFKLYKKVKIFVDKSIENAREKGYAETLLGRRRFLPEINSSVMTVRKTAERMAINTPLQGTAADMIKAAMIEIYKNRRSLNDAKMLLQVHDELLFEVADEKSLDVSKKIEYIMENVLKLKIPIVVEAKFGRNWSEMEKFNN